MNGGHLSLEMLDHAAHVGPILASLVGAIAFCHQKTLTPSRYQLDGSMQ